MDPELFDTEGGSYEVLAIHPELNLIFITNEKETTLSYNMDNREVNSMCPSEKFLDGLPYIPCFTKWLWDGLLKSMELHVSTFQIVLFRCISSCGF